MVKENCNEENFDGDYYFDGEQFEEEYSDGEHFDEEHFDEEHADEEHCDREHSDEEYSDRGYSDEEYFDEELEELIAIKKWEEMLYSGEDSSNNEVESDDHYICKTFDSMCLNKQLSVTLNSYGFDEPTPIQQRAIIPIIDGRDVMLYKDRDVHTTATFSIPIVQIVDTEISETQVLVLSPTKRKARVNERVICALGTSMGVRSYAYVDCDDDLEDLNEGLHVVTGTPKTILGMITKRYLETKSIQMVVIDECDKIFNQGLKKELYDICKYLHPNTQMVIVSANLQKETLRFPNKLGIDKRPMKTLLISDNKSIDLDAIQNSEQREEYITEEWIKDWIKD